MDDGLFSAIATGITVTNAGLFFIILLTWVRSNGRWTLGQEVIRAVILFATFSVALLSAHYLIWLLPIEINILDGVRRTYWVVANDLKSDIFRYALTFFAYSGVPPSYELVEVLQVPPFFYFRGVNYSGVGYWAAGTWVALLLVGFF